MNEISVRGAAALVTLILVSLCQGQIERVRYLSYDEARPILEGLGVTLPLKAVPPDEPAKTWNEWVKQRDAEIRARLIQGDEDSIVNFLLFGTSFTRQPRVSGRQVIAWQRDLAQSSADKLTIEGILEGRIKDFIQGLIKPADNERLLFARDLIMRQKGYNPASAAGRDKVKTYLLAGLQRVLYEQVSFQRVLAQARLQADTTEEFAARSKLYGTRGLSLDTSLLPNFALEQALSAMKSQGLFKGGTVRRVAIVGPGLDFTDKQEGYDFYPQQSIQPFAIVDSLLRLGLANPGDVALTTFDLSPRVNEHLARARRQAQQGQSYVIQLPRDLNAKWTTDAANYWSRFGDQIGTPAAAVKVPMQLPDLHNRAVRIRPSIVAKITPVDLNIVLQRLQLAPDEAFDLIIATNILVYYETFEQSLAAANIESMLKPGGFLLSNNAILELPSSQIRSVDYVTVVYSDRPNDGDHIVWYQRAVQ